MTLAFLWFIRNAWTSTRFAACVNLTLVCLLCDAVIIVKLLE
jgi:hypothetical protein